MAYVVAVWLLLKPREPVTLVKKPRALLENSGDTIYVQKMIFAKKNEPAETFHLNETVEKIMNSSQLTFKNHSWKHELEEMILRGFWSLKVLHFNYECRKIVFRQRKHFPRPQNHVGGKIS